MTAKRSAKKVERRKDVKPSKRPKAPAVEPGPSPLEAEVLALRAALVVASARARPKAATLTQALLVRLSPAEYEVITERSYAARRPRAEWVRAVLFGYDGPIAPIAPREGELPPDPRQLPLPATTGRA